MRDRGAQKKIVFDAFFQTPMTMMECDKKTGVQRSNICWYCRDFRELNKLYEVGKKVCSVSKEAGVTVLSTNPEFAPPQLQTKMF